MVLSADELQPAKHSNRFEALAVEDEDKLEEPTIIVQLEDAIKLLSRN